MATEITRLSPAAWRHRALWRGWIFARIIVAGLGLWLFAALPASADLSSEDIRELEELLVQLGFDPGPIDGIADGQTAVAIEGYQSFAALRVDGVVSAALLEELRGVAKSLGTDEEDPPAKAAPTSAASVAQADDEADDEAGDEAGADDQAGEILPSAPADPAAGALWETAIHLASFKQESKAHQEWQRLQQRLPNLLGDMDSAIRAFDLGDEGLFFRLYAGPFPNRATAQDFCVVMSLEGYGCGIAQGEAWQVAAAGPVPPELPEGSNEQEAQPEANIGAAVEAEDPPPEPVASASVEAEEAVTPVGTEASEPSPATEETSDIEAPDSGDTAARDEEVAVVEVPQEEAESPPTAQAVAEPADEEVAVVEIPEEDAEPSPAAQTVAEPAEEEVSDAATGAPSDPVTDTQIGEATPSEAPEDAPEEFLSPKIVGAPTLLIAATQFIETPLEEAPKAATEESPSRTAVGGPTVLVAAAQFGEAAEGENAAPEADTADSTEADSMTSEPVEAETATSDELAVVSVTDTAESAAGKLSESDDADVQSAAAETMTSEPAEAEPAAESETEATQTAALIGTGTEDYSTATAAFGIGDCSTALRYYERAFEKGGLPRRALASGHNNRGRCLYDWARYDEALADFDRAIELNREFAAAYYNRGRAHNAIGNSSLARDDLKAAYDLGFGRLQPLQ